MKELTGTTYLQTAILHRHGTFANIMKLILVDYHSQNQRHQVINSIQQCPLFCSKIHNEFSCHISLDVSSVS